MQSNGTSCGYGSSPREWGKRLNADRVGVHCRVIPTRVGKAARSPYRHRWTTGHPHASGESFPAHSRHSVVRGSSPREWGKLLCSLWIQSNCRVIPTRVGKATSRFRQPTSVTGHPHASGESNRIEQERKQTCGSSPREWGKQSEPWASAATRRVIPTRVGKAQKCSRSPRMPSGHPHASGESR